MFVRHRCVVQPLRTLAHVGEGLADLVRIPVARYRRDGRVLTGMVMGMAAFARVLTLESLDIGAKLAVGAQVRARAGGV